MGKKFKIVFFYVVVIAIIGFVMFYSNKSNYKADRFLITDLDNKEKIQILENVNKLDSDNDGLKDWEEGLWGTDPNNPDTDGDGTNDGDEVNIGRNPSVAGPDDKLTDNHFVENTNSNFSDENITKTDKFSQEFFTKYLSLRGSKEQLSDEDKNNLINTSVNDIIKTYSTNYQYGISDLNISQDTSRSNSKKYGNIMGEIILKHSFETEDELTIFNKSVTNSDVKEIQKLEPIIKGYKNILKDTLLVSVPQDAVDEHIAFMQSIVSVVESIENMSLIYNDPIRAIAGINSYEQSVFLLKDAFGGMKSYFSKKGIIFKESDSGYVMTNVI